MDIIILSMYSQVQEVAQLANADGFIKGFPQVGNLDLPNICTICPPPIALLVQVTCSNFASFLILYRDITLSSANGG